MTHQCHSWAYTLRIERDTCTPIFTAAMFTIARIWKQPRCPSADEWIRKLWYIYTMEYSVQLLSHVRLFVTPLISAHQASLSITNSWSLLKLKFIESVMPSSHLILCHPLLLLPQSLPESGSFPMCQLFASGGQSIGISASVSVLPKNMQG